LVSAALRSFRDATSPFSRARCWMHTGTLIQDLFTLVKKAEDSAASAVSQEGKARTPHAAGRDTPHGKRKRSEAKQFPQPLGLGPADWNFALLLIVHAQLVGAFEPGDDLADTVDVHQVGAVRPPEKIGV